MSGSGSREEQLFADALGRAEHERAPFLDEACRGDAALRERIIALLAAHAGPESLLASAPTKSVGLPEENAGDVIGRYKLLQKIGEGGCGVVWMAEQEEPVRRRVALKVIKLGMDTKAVVARFEAERQALAMMDHANIAKVHDAGATETGRPFFVMELVRGIPITKYCDENHLTPTARLELFIKVCHAIQHAHQKGVIHRDIKPSNILVTVNDGAATPKVIDFGIAKATQGKLTDATVFTAFEQFIGTPVYMSPEQAEMSSLDIDTRSDIYSLGILLYELLTGRPPFDPKAFAQAGVDQIRRQIREVEPAKPSRRLHTLDDEERTTIARLRNTAPAQLTILLRGDLDWIVMRCIEKDRTRRYETANAVAMDIQRHLHNEPVVARPASTAYLVQKLIRRHRVGFSAAAVVLVVIVFAAIVSIWQGLRARHAERQQLRLRVAAESAQHEQSVLRATAERREKEALQVAAVLRRTTYVAEMNIAGQAIAEGNLGRAQLLLQKHRPKPGEEDVRGFEWRYLWAKARGDALIDLAAYRGGSIGHGGIAVSPDGRWLATAAAPDIEIRSTKTNALVKRLPKLGNNIGVLKFSPDSDWLVCCHLGATALRRWRTRTWQEEAPVEEVQLPLTFAGSRRAFVARRGDRLSLWSTESWTRITDLPGAISCDTLAGLQSLTATTDGNYVFFSGDRRIGIQCWDLDRLAQLEPLRPPSSATMPCVAISPRGLLAAAHQDGRVTLWEPAARRLLQTFDVHHAWVTAVAFSADGMLLASASADQTIAVYDVEQKTHIRRLTGHTGEVWALAFHPDGDSLISGSIHDGTLRIWSLRARDVRPHRVADLIPLSFVDRSQTLIGWSSANGFVEFDPVSGSAAPLDYRDVPVRFDPIGWPVQLCPNTPLIGNLAEGRIEIWNLESGVRERVLELAVGPIAVMAFSSDGAWVAASGPQGVVRLWKTEDWSSKTLPPGEGNMWRLAFSADNKRLAVLSRARGKAVCVYDLTTNSAPVIFDGPSLYALSFSPDGTKLAASGLVIYLWDVEQRRQLAMMSGHTGGIIGLAFAPDGQTLASCGNDHFVKLWNVETFQEIFALPSLRAHSFRAKFSSDGNWLAVSSVDNQVQLWHAPSWADIERAEKADVMSPRAP